MIKESSHNLQTSLCASGQGGKAVRSARLFGDCQFVYQWEYVTPAFTSVSSRILAGVHKWVFALFPGPFARRFPTREDRDFIRYVGLRHTGVTNGISGFASS